MKIAPHFTLEEFRRASRTALTRAEEEAARVWAGGVLHAIREQFGPVRVTSFVRVTELAGARRGQIETGPHGRRSSVPGNGVDIVVQRASSRAVVQWLATQEHMFALGHLFAALDGGDHVHLTRAPHPGSTPGVGVEYRKPDGTTGVHALGARPPASSPAPAPSPAPEPMPGELVAPPVQLDADAGLQLLAFVALGIAGAWYLTR